MISILLNGVIYTGVSVIIKRENTTINGVLKYNVSIYNIDQLIFAKEYDAEATADAAFTSITEAFTTNGMFINFDIIFNS